MKKFKTSRIKKAVFVLIASMCFNLLISLIMHKVQAREHLSQENLSRLAPRGLHQYNYDSDNKADLWLFKDGVWRIRKSSDAQIETISYGTAGDIPVLGLYNSQSFNRADIAIWRPSTSLWSIRNGSGGHFGINSDKPVPGDYDGDGKDDIAVFRDGAWYILNSSNQTVSSYSWGASGDIPISGNVFYDIGRSSLTVFRPSNSTWYSLSTFDGSTRIRQFGNPGDIAVPGDYDYDRKMDFAIFRPSNGTWWYIQSSDDETVGFQWGASTDIPVPADYDGDAKFDYAVYRPSNFTWYIVQSSNTDTVQFVFGDLGEVPVQNILHR